MVEANPAQTETQQNAAADGSKVTSGDARMEEEKQVNSAETGSTTEQ